MFWVFATIIGFLSCLSKKNDRYNNPRYSAKLRARASGKKKNSYKI